MFTISFRGRNYTRIVLDDFILEFDVTSNSETLFVQSKSGSMKRENTKFLKFELLPSNDTTCQTCRATYLDKCTMLNVPHIKM